MLMAGDSNRFRRFSVARFSVGVAMLTATAALLAGCSDDNAGSDDSSSSDSSDSAKNSRSGELKVGDPGKVEFEKDGMTTTMEITPLSIAQGQPAEVADLKISGNVIDPANSVPFYVKTRFTNAGSATMTYPGFPSVFGIDNTGQTHFSVIGLYDFAPCTATTTPETWGPGAAHENCGVFLLPKGRSLEELESSPVNDVRLTWKK